MVLDPSCATRLISPDTSEIPPVVSLRLLPSCAFTYGKRAAFLFSSYMYLSDSVDHHYLQWENIIFIFMERILADRSSNMKNPTLYESSTHIYLCMLPDLLMHKSQAPDTSTQPRSRHSRCPTWPSRIHSCIKGLLISLWRKE